MLRFALPLCATVLAFSFTVQERVKPREANDFPGCLTAAQNAWKEGRLGECTRQLQEALALVSERRAVAMREAMPAAPDGYEIVPPKPTDPRANAMLAGMSAAVGSMITQEYRPVDARSGRSTISVTLTADSPMVQMIAMMTSNPAMLGQDAELIKYGPTNAILKKDGQRRSLQILIAGKHLCDVTWPNEDEDALLAMFDQAAVTKLTRALEE